ncbi:hypothetical protein OG352_08175 [Streptomyces sp. NBC_01485]|uniref:CIS tube protein n=1 Tax=Streptomyces sp. NBC_01485 TaxID=2903884 RepID=UPI002E365C1D|nr:hypothetical protein [Streptomyces sp. NBC_01485]
MSITPETLQKQRAAMTSRRVPRAPAPPLAPDGNAKLGPAKSTTAADYVEFDFNPATIVISHAAPVEPTAGLQQQGENRAGISDPKANVELAAISVDEVEKAKGTTSINLRSLTFDGTNVARTCLRLLKWSHFVAARDKTSTQRTELPRLKFIWGSQVYLVHLNQVTVTYTRFSPSGTPLRATVDLTLHSIPNIPGPTNPSSGGLAGRRTHLLSGAETLPELATRCYGGPEHWREIAAANRFDDPLRVRPGTRVYLPSTQEGER